MQLMEEFFKAKFRAFPDKIGTSAFQCNVNVLLGYCPPKTKKFRLKVEIFAPMGEYLNGKHNESKFKENKFTPSISNFIFRGVKILVQVM